MHQNAAVMKSLLYIFIGGGTGSVLRYLLTIAIQRQTGTAFPWGTFAVNFLGCILIGVFYTLTSRIHITTFFAYVIGSVVLGIIGVMLGVWMSE